MSQLKQDLTQAEQQAKNAALNVVNEGENWIQKHKVAAVIIAVVTLIAIGFFLAHGLSKL